MIVVLMGAPAAGKSTWVRKHINGDEHIYNTEAVRMNRDLDIGAFMQYERMKAIKAVENGKSLIADGTHTIASHRQVWLNLAERLGLETRLVVFETALPILLEGNAIRQFPAPRKVVIEHHRRMQLAKYAVNREGWGSIERIVR